MAKRNWPTHPGIGREVKVDGIAVKVVDVKCGPILGNVRTALDGTEQLRLEGTLKLRVKYPSGVEKWLPPTSGPEFCAWCARQDDAKKEGA